MSELSELNERIWRCQRCETSKLAVNQGCGKLAGYGDENSKIFWLAQNPSMYRNGNDKVFGNPASEQDMLFDRMLERIGLHRLLQYITNGVKCSTGTALDGKNRVPFPYEIQNCSEYWKIELKIVNPIMIVGIGVVSCNQLDAKIGDHSWYGERPVFGIWHPSFICRQRDRMKEYEEQFDALKRFMSNISMHRRQDFTKQKNLMSFGGSN